MPLLEIVITTANLKRVRSLFARHNLGTQFLAFSHDSINFLLWFNTEASYMCHEVSLY